MKKPSSGVKCSALQRGAFRFAAGDHIAHADVGPLVVEIEVALVLANLRAYFLVVDGDFENAVVGGRSWQHFKPRIRWSRCFPVSIGPPPLFQPPNCSP